MSHQLPPLYPARPPFASGAAPSGPAPSAVPHLPPLNAASSQPGDDFNRMVAAAMHDLNWYKSQLALKDSQLQTLQQDNQQLRAQEAVYSQMLATGATHAQDNAQLRSQLADLQQQLAALALRAATAQADRDAMLLQLDQHKTQQAAAAAAAQTRADALQCEVARLQGELDAGNLDRQEALKKIAQLEAVVTQHTATVEPLQAQLTTAQTTIASLQQELQQLSGATSQHQASLDLATTESLGLRATITELKAKIASTEAAAALQLSTLATALRLPPAAALPALLSAVEDGFAAQQQQQQQLAQAARSHTDLTTCLNGLHDQLSLVHECIATLFTLDDDSCSTTTTADTTLSASLKPLRFQLAAATRRLPSSAENPLAVSLAKIALESIAQLASWTEAAVNASHEKMEGRVAHQEQAMVDLRHQHQQLQTALDEAQLAEQTVQDELQHLREQHDNMAQVLLHTEQLLASTQDELKAAKTRPETLHRSVSPYPASAEESPIKHSRGISPFVFAAEEREEEVDPQGRIAEETAAAPAVSENAPDETLPKSPEQLQQQHPPSHHSHQPEPHSTAPQAIPPLPDNAPDETLPMLSDQVQQQLPHSHHSHQPEQPHPSTTPPPAPPPHHHQPPAQPDPLLEQLQDENAVCLSRIRDLEGEVRLAQLNYELQLADLTQSHAAALAHLQSALSQQQSASKSLQLHNDELQQRLDSAQHPPTEPQPDSCEALKLQVATLEARLTDVRADLNRELKAKLDETQKQLEALALEKDAKEKVQSKKRQEAALEIATLQSELKSREATLTTLKETVALLQSKHGDVEVIQQLQSRALAAEHANKQLHSELDEQKTCVAVAKSRIAELEEQERQRERLAREGQAEGASSTESVVVDEEFRDWTAAVETLAEAVCGKLEAQVARRQNGSHPCTQYDQAALAQLHAHFNQWAEEQGTKLRRLAELEKLYVEAQTHMKQLTAKMQGKDAVITNYDQDLNKLQAALRTITEQETHIARLKTEQAQLQQKLAEHQQLYIKLEEQMEDLRHVNDALKDRRQYLATAEQQEQALQLQQALKRGAEFESKFRSQQSQYSAALKRKNELIAELRQRLEKVELLPAAETGKPLSPRPPPPKPTHAEKTPSARGSLSKKLPSEPGSKRDSSAALGAVAQQGTAEAEAIDLALASIVAGSTV